MYYFKISSRSLLSKWRQYVSLFLVSMFGVAISLFLMFVVKGMLSSMATKAKNVLWRRHADFGRI